MAIAAAIAVSVATAVVTGVTQGVSNYYQSKSAAKSAEKEAEYQRKLAQRARQAANEEARGIEMQQAAEERTQRRKNAALLARNRARIGASGIAYSGSTLLTEIDNAMNMELDIQNQRIDALNRQKFRLYEGHLQSVSYENKAREYDATASNMKQAAKYAQISAIMYGTGLVPFGGEVTEAIYKTYQGRSDAGAGFQRLGNTASSITGAFAGGKSKTGGKKESFYNTSTGYSVTNKPSLLVG